MVVAPAVDWDQLEAIGIYDELRPYLVRNYEDPIFGVVVDNSWENAFRINENVYMELTLEFIATFKYNQEETQNNSIRFRLMGLWHDFTLAQFASLLDLYPEHLTRHPHFPTFLAEFETGPFTDHRNTEFFRQIANVGPQPSDNKISQVRNPIHRILHRFITFTVSQSFTSNKCPNLDLLPLWGAINPRNKLNLPHIFATYFRDRAMGQYASSPICGGNFVTRIAKKLGDMNALNMITVKYEVPRILSESHFNSMIMRIGRSNRYTFVPPLPPRDPIPPGVEHNQPQPAAPRNTRPRQHEPVQSGPEPEMNIQYLYDRMVQMDLNRQQQDMQRQREANALGTYFDDTNMFLGHVCQQAGYGYPTGYPFQTWNQRMSNTGGQQGGGGEQAGGDYAGGHMDTTGGDFQAGGSHSIFDDVEDSD